MNQPEAPAWSIPAQRDPSDVLDPRLASLVARFNSVPSNEIHRVVEDALAEMIGGVGADRATLTVVPPGARLLRLAGSWSRAGVPRADTLSIDLVFPWAIGEVLEGRGFLFSDLDELPDHAVSERRWFQQDGVRAHISMPLQVGGEVIGGLHAAFMRPHRWTDGELAQIRVAADVFAAAVLRSQTEEALRSSQETNIAVLTSLPFGIVIVDSSGEVVSINESVRTTAAPLGLPTADLAEGDSYIAAWSEAAANDVSHAGTLVSAITDVMSGREDRLSVEHAAADGTESWFVTRVVRLRAQRGGAVVMHVDVSDERSRQSELEQALTEVEDLKDRFEADAGYLRAELDHAKGSGEIVGDSAPLRQALGHVQQVAARDTTVLLLGETGTAKELIARTLHAQSERAERPLVSLNCAALPPSLVESELFGYERGAFTGAVDRRRGYFELADGGTIFLDEIGDLETDIQTRLLRVLQEGEIQRLGAEAAKYVDVRVIAATNRDLSRAVVDGRFRQDLFYRLNVFPIRVPALRDRPEDVPALTWHFVQQLEAASGRHIKSIKRSTMRRLERYPWPGNVRELRNVIERSLVLGDGPSLEIEGLLDQPGEPETEVSDRLDDVARVHILKVLRECDGTISGSGNAADRLGIHANTLRHRMKKLGITAR
ncbi:MAG: GAF domain-containing protein [Acidobacteria bacterium]|nr:GAF domain-containing protein [Acidobacteriota bacterium]